MKTFFLKPVKRAAQILLFGAIVWACQESEPDFANFEQATEQSKVTTKDNNEIIAATQGALEITGSLFENEGISNGRAVESARVGHGNHKGDGCSPEVDGSFNVDKPHKDTVIYTGTFIIDYGDGSSCDSSNVKKGVIEDNFTIIVAGHGQNKTVSSVEKISFRGFVNKGVQLDGVFTVKGVKNQYKTIGTGLARLTYADGTSTQWKGYLGFAYDNGESSNWKDNIVRVTGRNQGTNRDGTGFNWQIRQEVVYRYDCHVEHKFYPISGVVKVINVAGPPSVINFGDGTCDTKYTITTNGVTEEFDFESDN